MANIPECPVCRIAMDAGHVLVSTQNGWVNASWVEGEAEKTLFYGFKVKGKKKLDMISYRCPKCGWLVWFAPDVETNT